MRRIRANILLTTKRLRVELTETSFQSIPYLAGGVISATVCSIFNYVFKESEKVFFLLIDGQLYLIFVIAPLCFVGAWLMTRAFAPEAAGSGIPQVIAALEESSERKDILSRLLSFRVIIIKILSASLMVLGGGAVGREGPSIQISASVFYIIREYWVKLGNKLALKNMLIAGGAGGIAAAFNTPLGGVIYAVEELARDHVSNFRVGLLEAVITAGLVAQLFNGPYLFLGFPLIPEMHRKSLFAVILIAAICGILGAALGRALYFGLKYRLKFNFNKSLGFIVILSLLFATLVFFVGLSSVGSGKEIISDILFKQLPVSFPVAMGRILGPLLASLSGASGGVFAPALAAGAAVGEWMGNILSPGLHNLAPICGMVGFLTGLTRTPVTAFVLILEMTDRHSSIFPMMLSALIAHLFARVVDRKSFYENMAHQIVLRERAKEKAKEEALNKA
ncbi:MAG: chloride channel protein [Bdellovibrionales bacterium]|nr:chloride channel protein [Bdellovibrionales bacterium]